MIKTRTVTSVREAAAALSRYIGPDDVIYLNPSRQLVIESVDRTSAGSYRALSMVIRQVRNGARALGLVLNQDLSPTTFRVPESGGFATVATFTVSRSAEAEQKFDADADARRHGFKKTRDGWVIDQRGGNWRTSPYGLAYASVVPDRGRLRWQVMDRLGKSQTGVDSHGPGVFSKVKRLYDRAKNRPGDLPESVREFNVSFEDCPYCGYDRGRGIISLLVNNSGVNVFPDTVVLRGASNDSRQAITIAFGGRAYSDFVKGIKQAVGGVSVQRRGNNVSIILPKSATARDKMSAVLRYVRSQAQESLGATERPFEPCGHREVDQRRSGLNQL